MKAEVETDGERYVVFAKGYHAPNFVDFAGPKGILDDDAAETHHSA